MPMNILFLSNYGKSDTRTRAFIHIMRALGETVCVTKRVPEKTSDVDAPGDRVVVGGARGILDFIKTSVSVARAMGTVDALFIDNRMATIPGRIISRRFRPKLIVQDAREFYTLSETHHLAGKFGCLLEESSLRKADVVFCANHYRAEAMQKTFRLRNLPHVFENVFTLSFDETFDPMKASQQYRSLFGTDHFTFLSSSGCILSRTTDRLVTAMEEFQEKAQLLLVGRNTREDEQKIREIVERRRLKNVHILGGVNKNTLKWLIQASNAGIAIYGKHDSNNLYCASGKIYEFLSEGLPVMASDNPPLLDFFKQTKAGYASDNYAEAMREIMDHYEDYKQNVERYMRNFDMRAAWNEGEQTLRMCMEERGLTPKCL